MYIYIYFGAYFVSILINLNNSTATSSLSVPGHFLPAVPQGSTRNICLAQAAASDTAQCAAVLAHDNLTQAEEKVVPINRLSFRPDVNHFVTFHLLLSMLHITTND